jgi:hypothetical protein
MLVTVERWREITGRTEPDDDVVAAAITQAEQLVSEYLRRPLEHGVHTEHVVVVDGVARPAATPVTAPPEGWVQLSPVEIASDSPECVATLITEIDGGEP